MRFRRSVLGLVAAAGLAGLAGCASVPTPLCNQAAQLVDSGQLAQAAELYARAEQRQEGACSTDGLDEVGRRYGMAFQDAARGTNAEIAGQADSAKAAYESALRIDAGNQAAATGLVRLGLPPAERTAPLALPEVPSYPPPSPWDSWPLFLVAMLVTLLGLGALAWFVVRRTSGLEPAGVGSFRRTGRPSAAARVDPAPRRPRTDDGEAEAPAPAQARPPDRARSDLGPPVPDRAGPEPAGPEPAEPEPGRRSRRGLAAALGAGALGGLFARRARTAPGEHEDVEEPDSPMLPTEESVAEEERRRWGAPRRPRDRPATAAGPEAEADEPDPPTAGGVDPDPPTAGGLDTEPPAARRGDPDEPARPPTPRPAQDGPEERTLGPLHDSSARSEVAETGPGPRGSTGEHRSESIPDPDEPPTAGPGLPTEAPHTETAHAEAPSPATPHPDTPRSDTPPSDTPPSEPSHADARPAEPRADAGPSDARPAGAAEPDRPTTAAEPAPPPADHPAPQADQHETDPGAPCPNPAPPSDPTAAWPTAPLPAVPPAAPPAPPPVPSSSGLPGVARNPAPAGPAPSRAGAARGEEVVQLQRVLDRSLRGHTDGGPPRYFASTRRFDGPAVGVTVEIAAVTLADTPIVSRIILVRRTIAPESPAARWSPAEEPEEQVEAAAAARRYAIGRPSLDEHWATRPRTTDRALFAELDRMRPLWGDLLFSRAPGLDDSGEARLEEPGGDLRTRLSAALHPERPASPFPRPPLEPLAVVRAILVGAEDDERDLAHAQVAVAQTSALALAAAESAEFQLTHAMRGVGR
ncbi:hypothetical protein GCM10009836_46150 [Pseudonocardia ailaonensis]|uniref:Uncharacterized protein n=1 Tax=Pseudonocardia ailaonensis TaxID=367279 RepID=A0ABN2NEP1_9PSEU